MMTPEQLVILKTDILVQGASGGPIEQWLTDRNDMEIANWYNDDSAFIVWKTSVTEEEIISNGFAWTEVDALSVGKARIWEWMFRGGRAVNFTKTNVRDGVVNVWSGTSAKLAVQAAVFAHAKRPATRGEKLFTTGTGTDATPGLLGSFEGLVAGMDVSMALIN